MLKIGLTGGIGSGKTTVSDLFKKQNVNIIDTDIIARKLVNDNHEVLKEVSDTFGQDILHLDGTLNRKKLAAIIFNVKESKQQLENILHPKIQNQVLRQLQKPEIQQSPHGYVIIVIPLLIEANYENIIDRILVVTADEKERISRVQKRDKRSSSEIYAIINSQANDQNRHKSADDIIDNNNDIRDLDSQVEILHRKYLKLAQTIY